MSGVSRPNILDTFRHHGAWNRGALVLCAGRRGLVASRYTGSPISVHTAFVHKVPRLISHPGLRKCWAIAAKLAPVLMALVCWTSAKRQSAVEEPVFFYRLSLGIL
jgi:hypothetical protein